MMINRELKKNNYSNITNRLVDVRGHSNSIKPNNPNTYTAATMFLCGWEPRVSNGGSPKALQSM